MLTLDQIIASTLRAGDCAFDFLSAPATLPDQGMHTELWRSGSRCSSIRQGLRRSPRCAVCGFPRP